MDYTSANIMEFTAGAVKSNIILSKFTQQLDDNVAKNDNIINDTEGHQQIEYYKELEEAITNYNDVVLFGATNAKAELYGLLKEDDRFEKTKIEVKQTDTMTGNQQHAFVMEHFSRL